MFPVNFSTISFLSDWPGPVLLILGILIGVFLFWRAGRHELLDTEEVLDTVVIFAIGAVLGGRVLDFLIRADFYQWSAKKLVFANVYRGFDFLGALLGMVILAFIYLRVKRANFLQIFDLVVAPLVFIQMIYYLTKLISTNLIEGSLTFRVFKFTLSVPLLTRYLFYFVFYFVLFFVIKRLSVKKRYAGFFASFYLVFGVAVAIFDRLVTFRGVLPQGQQAWRAALEVAILVFGLILWYVLAKRDIRDDIKTVFAFFLLAVFRAKRVLTSIDEAGRIAKSLLFVPLFIVRSVYLLLRLLVFEVYLGFVELVNVFKVKK